MPHLGAQQNLHWVFMEPLGVPDIESENIHTTKTITAETEDPAPEQEDNRPIIF